MVVRVRVWPGAHDWNQHQVLTSTSEGKETGNTAYFMKTSLIGDGYEGN